MRLECRIADELVVRDAIRTTSHPQGVADSGLKQVSLADQWYPTRPAPT